MTKHLVSGDRLAPESVRRRIKPHRLLEHHARVGEVGDVLVARRAPFQHARQLRVQLRFHRRMLRQQIPGPSQRLCRGLVPGHEDGDHLVAHLLRRHAAAGLTVARGDQAGEQILRLGVRRTAALGEQPIDRGVELVEDSVSHARRDELGEPFGDMQQVEKAWPHGGLIFADATLDHVDDSVGIRGKHRARDDVQGRVHHRHRCIDHAVLRQRVPLRQQFLGDFGHDRRVAGDRAGIEGGRHDPAMAAPELPIGGDQPAPEPRLKDTAAEFGLFVVLRVVQQHMPHTARFVDDEGTAPEQPARDEVLVEVLRRVGGQYVFADHAEELPQAHAPFRAARGGEDRNLGRGVDDTHAASLGLYAPVDDKLARN